MIDPKSYMFEENPFQGVTQGFAQGFQLGEAYEDKQRAIAAAEKEELAKQAMMQDLSTLAKNPSAEMYSQTITKYPQLSEQLKRGYDIMDDGAKKSAVNTATQTSLLLNSGNISGAKDLLESRAVAFDNAGDKNQAGAYRAMMSMIDADPDQAKLSSYLIAAQGLTPEQFGEYNAKFGGERRENQLQPYEVAQAGANINKTVADTAKTQEETQYIAPKTLAEISNLESQSEDRTTGRVLEQQKMQLQNDQFYQNLDQSQSQFYETLNQNERKQAQAIAKVKETAEQRVTRLEKAQGFATAAKQAADGSVLAAKLANDFGTISDSTGGYWNKTMRDIPGTKEYDFNQKLETMKSKVFLSQIDQMRGLGALTGSEGAELKASIASINPNQSPEEVQNSLAEVAKALSNAAKTANKKTQLFTTKGQGYSAEVVEAARQRGISPAEMQSIATQLGL